MRATHIHTRTEGQSGVLTITRLTLLSSMLLSSNCSARRAFVQLHVSDTRARLALGAERLVLGTPRHKEADTCSCCGACVCVTQAGSKAGSKAVWAERSLNVALAEFKFVASDVMLENGAALFVQSQWRRKQLADHFRQVRWCVPVAPVLSHALAEHRWHVVLSTAP